MKTEIKIAFIVVDVLMLYHISTSKKPNRDASLCFPFAAIMMLMSMLSSCAHPSPTALIQVSTGTRIDLHTSLETKTGYSEMRFAPDSGTVRIEPKGHVILVDQWHVVVKDTTCSILKFNIKKI